MRLILVRHPPPLVPPGVCYGATDLAVSAQALEQVRAALAASASLPAHAALVSSPLQRCATLARAVQAPDGPAPVFDARLAEMHFGDWEMRSWDDIARAEIDAWAADLAHYRPGGGDSVFDVARRVAAFYAEIREADAKAKVDTVVICHAGTMRLLAACHAASATVTQSIGNALDAAAVQAIALQAASAAHRIGYGQVLVLER